MVDRTGAALNSDMEAAMYVASQTILSRFSWAAPAAMLRAGCVALFVCVSGCGGGAGGAAPQSSVPTPVPAPAPNPTPAPIPAPDTASPPPAPLVVGTALSIDSGASGTPLNLRVARSANGDGFAVWRSNNGTIVPGGGSRHDLWTNRYSAVMAAWGSPIKLRAGGADRVIPDFDLAVDDSGNATVAWTEFFENLPGRVVMSKRFDTGAGAWGAPVLLNANGGGARLASDASGALLAVYDVAVGVPNIDLVGRVRGRFFDPVSGNWQPEAAIDRNVGSNGGPIASLDGSGNALTVFNGSGGTRSNYYSLNVGIWGQLASGETVPDMEIPGTRGLRTDSLQLTALTVGNFLLAWDYDPAPAFHPDDPINEIRIARFTSHTGTWSPAQTLVPAGQNPPNLNHLQRMGSDAAGNAMVLLTQLEGDRFAVLKAIRLDHTGAACSGLEKIDRAIGGVAVEADLAVDPQGNAIAIWRQFEDHNRPAEGSRSNIAINRFDAATGTWASAVLAETEPGNAISPRASAGGGGQALLGWIQAEGGANRVKALLQPLTNTLGQ